MLYAIVLNIPGQMDLFSSECWGTCGKGIVGAVEDELVGTIGTCREPSATCPCFDKEIEEDFGEVQGEPLRLRKLKPRQHAAGE